MILGIRTDKPESELYLLNGSEVIDLLTWHAHRELSDTLLLKIEELLACNTCKLSDLEAIIAYQGPGSFTGLRIGISTANALAYALGVPIAAARGDTWQQAARSKLAGKTRFTTPVAPYYGSEAHITQPRK